MENYEPFGLEWVAEVSKMKKADLVGLLREALIAKEALRKKLRKMQEKFDSQ